MQKASWVISVVLLLAIASPTTRADSFTEGSFNFTVTGGNFAPPPTGSFVYDNTTNSFTSLFVQWESLGFDLSFCANGLVAPLPWGCSATSDTQSVYMMLTSDTNLISWGGSVDNDISGDGFFTINSSLGIVSEVHICCGFPGDNATGTLAVISPEPSAFGLTMLGIAGLLMMRKRIRKGLQQLC